MRLLDDMVFSVAASILLGWMVAVVLVLVLGIV